MTNPWKKPADHPRDPITGDGELSLIPRWSVLLAIVVFGAFQYLFHNVMPHAKHEMMPMRILMGYSWGTAFASYVLLVGYVSRDAKLAGDFHFCPQCQFQMAPACGQCFRSVQITDVYCVQCGHDLAQDQTPARLRAYRD
jgi:Zn ribbon nucleic-acid-binding protein